MAHYTTSTKNNRSRTPQRIAIVIIAFVLITASTALFLRRYYYQQLAPVSTSQQTQIFTVDQGNSVNYIANALQKQHLIRSAFAMSIYVHSKNLGGSVQAGTYALAPSDGTEKIVRIMTKGAVATRLVTILPGRRIDQIRTALINDGFTPDSVDAALKPAQYSSLPIMAFKPADVDTLEGLLWPDSFQKTANTDPAVIVRESLIEMGQQITPAVQAAFAQEGLTPYQGITLASIVTMEVSKPVDQTQVAQVFLSRLKMGMMLGSDVTANYGSIVAGRGPDLSYDSPYNTLLHTGLPPTPISTITKNALTAVTSPAATSWLYFVTGDDGVTHFSTNLQDHEALTQKYCHVLCGQ